MTTRIPVRITAGSGPTFGVDDLACAAATHLGTWSDEGLDVTWVPVHGGVAALKGVLDGSVDMSYGGLGPVLKARSEGKPVRIAVSMARALAQNLVAQKGITEVAQLAGASWALDGFGALSHNMARLLVRALGIAEEAIRWEAVGPPPERIARLLAGTIDVSLIRVEEAISLDLDSSNSLHTLLGFAELKRLVPVQPHGVLAMLESFEQAKPDTVQRVVRGMIRASRALNDSFDNFRAVYDRYVTVKVPAVQVQRIWQQERDNGGFAINGEVAAPHWQSQITLFEALNPGVGKVAFADVVAGRHVAEALAALGVRPGPDAPV